MKELTWGHDVLREHTSMKYSIFSISTYFLYSYNIAANVCHGNVSPFVDVIDRRSLKVELQFLRFEKKSSLFCLLHQTLCCSRNEKKTETKRTFSTLGDCGLALCKKHPSLIIKNSFFDRNSINR